MSLRRTPKPGGNRSEDFYARVSERSLLDYDLPHSHVWRRSSSRPIVLSVALPVDRGECRHRSPPSRRHRSCRLASPRPSSPPSTLQPSSIINVPAGTYTETLTIDKPLTLLGAEHGVDARGRADAATRRSSSRPAPRSPTTPPAHSPSTGSPFTPPRRHRSRTSSGRRDRPTTRSRTTSSPPPASTPRGVCTCPGPHRLTSPRTTSPAPAAQPERSGSPTPCPPTSRLATTASTATASSSTPSRPGGSTVSPSPTTPAMATGTSWCPTPPPTLSSQTTRSPAPPQPRCTSPATTPMWRSRATRSPAAPAHPA